MYSTIFVFVNNVNLLKLFYLKQGYMTNRKSRIKSTKIAKHSINFNGCLDYYSIYF